MRGRARERSDVGTPNLQLTHPGRLRHLESPSRLTNPSQACFVNYVLLLLPMLVMEQLC